MGSTTHQRNLDFLPLRGEVMADDQKDNNKQGPSAGAILSPKTLVYSGVLALGGLLGGGGVSVVSSPTTEAAELRADVKDMKNTVDSMNLTLTAIGGRLVRNDDDIQELKEDLKELEKRVREIERGED